MLPTRAAVGEVELSAPEKGRGLDGRSLVPFLEGREDPWFADRLLQAYDRGWDSLYPDMLAAGGDAALTEAAVKRMKGTPKQELPRPTGR